MRVKLLNFRDYDYRRRWTLAAFLIAVFMAAVSVHYFLTKSWPSIGDFKDDLCALLMLAFWVFGPPLWFFLEYFVLWQGANEEELERVRHARELAQPFWAAVLATMLIMVP